MNLARVNSNGSVHLGVENENFADNGRASVRIESKKRYEHGLYVWDVAHMPTGCGTWPTLGGSGLNVRTDDGEICEYISFASCMLLLVICKGLHDMQISSKVSLHPGI